MDAEQDLALPPFSHGFGTVGWTGICVNCHTQLGVAHRTFFVEAPESSVKQGPALLGISVSFVVPGLFFIRGWD